MGGSNIRYKTLAGYKSESGRMTVPGAVAPGGHARCAEDGILGRKDTMLHTRLHALWLLCSGRRMGELALVVRVHYRTPQRWASWYRTVGLNEVVSHKMKGLGQPRSLSKFQERELTEELGSGRFRRGGEFREWIESEYGVSFRLRSVCSLLARLGCPPRVTRRLHEKAGLRAQGSWRKRDSAMRSVTRE